MVLIEVLDLSRKLKELNLFLFHKDIEICVKIKNYKLENGLKLPQIKRGKFQQETDFI
jgi:hypothetical protein